MTIPARINIVTLGVHDLARSSAFYDALGWQRSAASSEEIIWFVTGGAVLGLFPYEELAADANATTGGRSGFGGITLAINVAKEDDVQPALDAAETAGGTLLKPATRAVWGGVSGYFADVDGYPWEIAWNPFFPHDDRGMLVMP